MHIRTVGFMGCDRNQHMRMDTHILGLIGDHVHSDEGLCVRSVMRHSDQRRRLVAICGSKAAQQGRWKPVVQGLPPSADPDIANPAKDGIHARP